MLLRLSFPNYNIWLLAYISFLPLFFALRNATKKEAFLLSLLFGLIFFGITIFWMHHVSMLGYILLILVLSIFFAIFGIFAATSIHHSLSAVIFIPACWIVLEYLRSHLLTGFGWALLGHSQYLNLPVIQIADIIGAYGVSFLIMMVNVCLYMILQRDHKRGILALLLTILVVSHTLGYGYLKLNEKESSFEKLKISIIQGNIPQVMKWDEKYKDAIFNIYSTLTMDAAKDKPELIIWPETALPGFMEERTLSSRTRRLAKSARANLLVGAPSLGQQDETVFNSAFLISKDGRIVGRYDKLHLVPFGEYIPFAEHLDFLRDVVDKPIGDFSAGKSATLFELRNGLRFGVLICFEDIFSDLVGDFMKGSPNFMVNITNDAWFMKTSAPYQHAQSSVFRAVENRVPVVRAANTGLSCFIDKHGRITDTVKLGKDEIFVPGYKTKNITISKGGSLYSTYGDLFVLFCIMLLVVEGGIHWPRRYY